MRNLFRPLAILMAVLLSLHGIAYAFAPTPGATPAVRTHGARVAARATAYATQATARPQRAHDSDRCGCPHGRLCCVDACCALPCRTCANVPPVLSVRRSPPAGTDRFRTFIPSFPKRPPRFIRI